MLTQSYFSAESNYWPPTVAAAARSPQFQVPPAFTVHKDLKKVKDPEELGVISDTMLDLNTTNSISIIRIWYE